jgi:hypothetical protein
MTRLSAADVIPARSESNHDLNRSGRCGKIIGIRVILAF